MHLAPAAAHPAAAGSASRIVVAGIDTHKDLQVAAVLDLAENVLATHSFSPYPRRLPGADPVGARVRRCPQGRGGRNRQPRRRHHRHLCDAGIEVLEVDRPDRSDRRRNGKDDDLDAISAARAVLHGRRTSTPKSKDGAVEALRVLRVTRTSAVRARRTALQLLRMQIVSAPQELREQVRNHPHAADPHLRRVAVRSHRRRRPDHRHPHRAEIVGPPDARARR